VADTCLATKPSFDLESAVLRFAQDWRCMALIVLAAVLQQAAGHLNGDDSWFLTFAERYRDGFIPYVDISDPNPPAAFLAYLPAVFLGRVFAAPPEFFVVFLTFVGVGASSWLAAIILRRAGLLPPDATFGALAIAAYVLLFVPAFCFGEREHIALLALLPMVALAAARASEGHVAWRDAVLAGVGCGIACAFKPYFLLPAACIVLCAAALRRKPRLLLAPEIFAAGTVILAYGIAIFVLFPAYLSTALPLAAEVYAPLRDNLAHILLSPLFLANFIVLAALFSAAWPDNIQPRTLVLAVASAGFLATFVIQGKGWMNHAYPGMALALLASASFLFESMEVGRSRRVFALFVFVPALCLAPFLFGTTKDFGNGEEYPGLTKAVQQVAPVHPKIAALAEQLDIGHPLVRRLSGTWVGHQNCLWVSWGVRYLLSEGSASASRRARLLGAIRDDEATFAADVDRNRPDILLVENNNVETWARRQAALAPVFQDYRQVAEASGVEVWQRDRRAQLRP
jgi:hypothetical protein